MKRNSNERSSRKDIWNAYICKGAKFCEFDVPYCPTTAQDLPKDIITWDMARAIYKKRIANKDNDFHYDAYICWYMDDYKFDGPRGIWHNPKFALKVLSHFAGAITPDFSTYQDFSEALKIYNTYRMRSFGYWLGKNGISVINNVRWGTEESYSYSFAGIPKESIIAIGTCGGSPRKLQDRERFERGLKELVARLRPHTIITYGSSRYPCFERLHKQGIKILPFSSKTNLAFERRKK